MKDVKKTVILTLLLSLILFLMFFDLSAQTYTNYYENGTGSYGFTGWPYPQVAPGFREYLPPGDDKVTFIIDAHGTGFRDRSPDRLNEGLAWYLNNENDLINPLTGQYYGALCVAGGKWVSSEEWANMIMYAANHPRCKRIVLSGLSGGAMNALRIIGMKDMNIYTELVSGVIAFSGSMFSRYDREMAQKFPVLIHHGANDRVRKPGNVAALKKELGDNVVLNIFSGIGHSSQIWHGAWTDRNRQSPLVDMKIGREMVRSDPYMSVWEFLKIMDTYGKVIEKADPTLDGDVGVYINDEYRGDMFYGKPYQLNDSTVLIARPKTTKL